ncbi:scavenger receptor class B, member [Chamberlinius hualienensis]
MVSQDEKKIKIVELQVPVINHSSKLLRQLKCLRSSHLCLGLLLGFGTMFLVGNSYILYNFDSIFKVIVGREVILKENGAFFEQWKAPPIAFTVRAYLFNITNVHEFPWNNSKPQLSQLGPYVFREYWNRTNFKWYENGTLSYTKLRTFEFVEAMSNGSLSDKITNFNVLLLTVADKLRTMSPFLRLMANPLFRFMKESMFTEKSAGELLFDGYPNPILKLAKTFRQYNFLPDRFAYMIGRNRTENERFTVFTGLDGRTETIGITERFNEEDSIGVWGDASCNKIRGTDGSSFPPGLDKTDIEIYQPFLCRSFNLSFHDEIDFHGLNVYNYLLAEKSFVSGYEVTDNKCYCQSERCMKTGIMYLGPCYYGLPIYLSQPHFYQADESFVKAFDGLEPNSNLHSTFALVEPLTGVPMSVSAKLQLNAYIEQVPNFGMFSEMPTMIFPLIWTEEAVTLDEKMVDTFKSALFMPMFYVKCACSTLLAFGLIALSIIPFILYKDFYKYKYYSCPPDKRLNIDLMASSIFMLTLIAVTLNKLQPINANELNLCPTNQLVISLSFEHLVDLVSKWAIEKRLPTAIVLKQLENRLIASSDLQFRQHLMTSSSGLPPPFALKPPMDIHQPELRKLQTIDIPSPPANAIVRINDVTSAEVTVSPRMSVAEALRLAFATLSDANGRKYKINLKRNTNRNCYVIRSVGSLTSNGRLKWVVDVTDKKERKIWRDACLPTLSQLQIRPGNVITLEVLTRERRT